jgi:hypothetical protein
MNLAALVVLITIVNLAVALLSVYIVLRSTRRYLKKAIKRIRRQRNEDLRWHRESLLSHMRMEEALRRRA